MEMEADMDQIDILGKKIKKITDLCLQECVSQEIVDQLNALKEIYSKKEQEITAECSAQLSLYPLRKPTITPTIQAALSEIERFDLEVSPGAMSTLLYGDEIILWHALRNVFSKASEQGDIVMVLTVSNACPKPKA